MRGVADMQDDVGGRHLLQRARKASTSWVGSSEMKPTVSDRITVRPEVSRIARMVGSSVAKSWSCA
jgi:hypothetical protein